MATSAITAAREQIAAVGADAELGPADLAGVDLALDGLATAIELPDGKTIYPPKLHGAPIDQLACELLDMQDPAQSKFLRLIGPPGTGKSQLARSVAHRLWHQRGRAVTQRHDQPFYGFVEMTGGPSSDEFTFKYEFVPDPQRPGEVKIIPSAFVEAMEHGWVVMIDEVNTIRDVALLSLNATLDGRLSLYLPSEGRTVMAQPGFAVLIAYNPGLIGASDIPDAWHSRFPATIEVTSNWAALAALGAPEALVKAAKLLDQRRMDPDAGLVWTPQFRDIEALWHMIERVGERAALALFISNLHEQTQAGKVQDAEAAATCRMLDEAGYAELKVRASGTVANLHGYPRAVTA